MIAIWRRFQMRLLETIVFWFTYVFAAAQLNNKGQDYVYIKWEYYNTR